MGVYQPRTRRGAMTDALDDARRAIARVLRIAMLRGAGATLCLASVAAFVALASYHHAATIYEHQAAIWMSCISCASPGCFGIRAERFLHRPAKIGRLE